MLWKERGAEAGAVVGGRKMGCGVGRVCFGLFGTNLAASALPASTMKLALVGKAGVSRSAEDWMGKVGRKTLCCLCCSCSLTACKASSDIRLGCFCSMSERKEGVTRVFSNCKGCSCWKLLWRRFCWKGKREEGRVGLARSRRAFGERGEGTGNLGGIRTPEWRGVVVGANTVNCCCEVIGITLGFNTEDAGG